MEIENKYWRGEPLKAIIKFANSGNYTVYTDKGESNNFINSAKFSLSEGNNRVNPLGVSMSNSVTLEIYDESDSLSPANTTSKYYGDIVNGVEIELFISYNGTTWSKYGIWYVTSWDGSYTDGGHGMVHVSAEDKLNTIGNMDLPKLNVYSGIQAGDLIANVFNGIGISGTEYTIEPQLNKQLTYGVAQGGKVREFLNNICQLLFARVVIDREGIIRFVPALSFYSTGNEITLGASETGSFQNKNNSNINYNKLSVKYLMSKDTSREQLFKDSNHSLSVGINTITDIKFKNKVLSIEQVECLYDRTESKANIDSIHYEGYQDGIALTIIVSGGDITDCELRGEGIIVSTTDKYVTMNVENTSIIGGNAFEFDTKQMMTESEATNIASNLKEYISKIGRNVSMQGTALTPQLYVGDKVTIEGTQTMYDGVYKITGLDIEMGENYSLSSTFIRIE